MYIQTRAHTHHMCAVEHFPKTTRLDIVEPRIEQTLLETGAVAFEKVVIVDVPVESCKYLYLLMQNSSFLCSRSVNMKPF
jgi:hypothetical protein